MCDQSRRKIIQLLAEREYTQAEIVNHFAISQPAVTKHLKLLKKEALINERRIGRYCYYSLNKEQFEKSYLKVRQEMEQMIDNKLASLKHYVEHEQE